MAMLNLKVFSNRDKQNFIAFLNMCEQQGINELWVARDQLTKSLSDDFANMRHSLTPEQRKVVKTQQRQTIEIEKDRLASERYAVKNYEDCPSCNRKGTLRRAFNGKGSPMDENIWGCMKCRYSEYRGQE